MTDETDILLTLFDHLGALKELVCTYIHTLVIRQRPAQGKPGDSPCALSLLAV